MDNDFIKNLRGSGLGALSQRNTNASAPAQQTQTQPQPQRRTVEDERKTWKNIVTSMGYGSMPVNTITRKVYGDGSVDVKTMTKAPGEWDYKKHAPSTPAEYSYEHISSRPLKNAVYSAYQGKYSRSEVRNVINDEKLKDIYENVGASLNYNTRQKAAITSIIDTYLDKKWGGPENQTEQVEGSVEVAEPETAAQLPESTSSQTPTPVAQAPVTAETSETVDYTYQPGDNFGNVLIKMGLSDGRNLWGPNGDVAYYTKQLNDQGIYGNIPVGTTIRLRRRV